MARREGMPELDTMGQYGFTGARGEVTVIAAVVTAMDDEGRLAASAFPATGGATVTSPE